MLENIPTAIETIKIAIGLAQKSNDAPLIIKLHEVSTSLFELQNENQSLKQTIANLKNLQIIRENLIFKSNSYWKKEADSTISGPYCSTCFDVKEKLIRLIQISVGCYQCKNCTAYIYFEPERDHSLRQTTDDYSPFGG